MGMDSITGVFEAFPFCVQTKAGKLGSWKGRKGGKGEFGCAISLSAKEVLYCNNIFSFLPQVKGMPVATSATINNIQMADKGDLRRLEC